MAILRDQKCKHGSQWVSDIGPAETRKGKLKHQFITTMMKARGGGDGISMIFNFGLQLKGPINLVNISKLISQNAPKCLISRSPDCLTLIMFIMMIFFFK